MGKHLKYSTQADGPGFDTEEQRCRVVLRGQKGGTPDTCVSPRISATGDRFSDGFVAHEPFLGGAKAKNSFLWGRGGLKFERNICGPRTTERDLSSRTRPLTPCCRFQQGAHVVAGGVVLAAALWVLPREGELATLLLNMAYVLAFGLSFGVQCWMTFVNGESGTECCGRGGGGGWGGDLCGIFSYFHSTHVGSFLSPGLGPYHSSCIVSPVCDTEMYVAIPCPLSPPEHGFCHSCRLRILLAQLTLIFTAHVFRAGVTIIRILPRPWFGAVQSRLFPRYFLITLTASAVMLGVTVARHPDWARWSTARTAEVGRHSNP